MFTEEQREEILKKLDTMSDEERDKLNENVRKAFNETVFQEPKRQVCMCCYCQANRPIG